ncbi:mas-related G-protein coupled receptor member X3-like [Macaca thibetana thibetana]|uniref:mas-related G-protein coupled receptor member X3-like n=1 Tax=Macaca thibetana thibetana TaxID=257877 RepID=UPI0021BC7B2A|nr:mas-related G-protein coupled receptor member X3-like [Macaca thibetana thibetana]
MDPTIPALGTSVTRINGTVETPCYKLTLSLTVLTCIVSLLGLTGNAVELWLLGFRMRRNAVSTYILNLAVADFLFLSGHVLRFLLSLINIPHTTRRILICVMTVPYLTGLSMLSAISTERCLSVLWPMWYRCRRPRHLSVVVCVLLWVLSLLRSILEWMFCDFPFSGADSFLQPNKCLFQLPGNYLFEMYTMKAIVPYVPVSVRGSQLSALGSSQLGRPLWGAANKDFRGIGGSVGGSQAPAGHKEGAWLPLSKHRGMMWSFDPGTGDLGQIPGLTRCVCVRMYKRVRGYSWGREGTRTGVFGVFANGHGWQTSP